MMKNKLISLAVVLMLSSLNTAVVHASSKPVCAAIPNKSVVVGQPVQFALIATDADGDSLSYSILGIPKGAYFVNNAFSWIPASDQIGTFHPVLRAFDGTQYCDVMVPITVSQYANVGGAQMNRAPVWDGNLTSYTVGVGQALQFYVGASDADGDMLTYEAWPLPQYAKFDVANHLFSWTPRADQVHSYQVRFRAGDGKTFGDLLVTLNVVPHSTPVAAAPVKPKPSNPVIPTANASQVSGLTVFNERVDITSEGNVLISWDTNTPARGFVAYGLLTQANHPNDFQYEFNTPEDSALSTHHQISLGDKFEKQRSYYFRVVVTVGNSRAISTEHSFILLNEGGVTSASVLGTLGGIFFGPLLWVIIIAILLFYFFSRRKRGEEPHESEDDEIVIGGHEEAHH